MVNAQDFQDLLSRELPQLPIRTVTPVQEGWDSFVLEINGEWIFRFPRREDVLPGLEKELRLLPLLAGRLPAPVPQVEYLARREDGRLLCMGYHKIPGARLNAAALKQDYLAGQVAGFLSALHDLPPELVTQAGIPVQDPMTWRSGYLGFLDWACEHAFPRLSPILREQTECFWEEYLQNEANFTFQPCLVHRDLGPEHILVDRGSLSGVIDWGDAAVGDPAIDFAGLYGMGDPDGFDRLLSHSSRAIEPSFACRTAFYATVAPFHEIRFGLEVDDPAHLHAGIRALENSLGKLYS